MMTSFAPVPPASASSLTYFPPKSLLQHGIHTCSGMDELKQYHSQIIRLGLSTDNDIMGRLIKFSALAQSGDLNYAHKMFAKLPQPDAFIYNTLIRGYLHFEMIQECFIIYLQMLEDIQAVVPNRFTFPSLIRACCSVDEDDDDDTNGKKKVGRQIHAHLVKFGFQADGFSQNNLIYMYVSFGSLAEARRIFDQIPKNDPVSWTTMISGYTRWGFIDEAREVFDSMPNKNSASWNAMISGFVRQDRFHDAFTLFDRMRSGGVAIDKFVAASMLSACTGLGALKQGEWIHEYIKKRRTEIDSQLATTMINMYCKCGSLDKAVEVFTGLTIKGISSWNCMIGGYAMHGKGKEAIELFKEMEKTVYPDYITFVNLLSACAHSGLVEKGRYYFQYMTEVHGIEPRTEHVGCMVDLLGRAGLLEEAKRLIDENNVGDDDASVFGALAGACKIHGNLDLGERIAKRAIELDPNNSGRYMLLANLYARAGRWEDVANVRKLMNDRNVKKAPGISQIEAGGVINEFIAGGRAHAEAREIYAMVDDMLNRIRCIGYVPDTESVLQDVDEEEKENPLHFHSEKLAIAFGLLKTKFGETIRITKNLRVCVDCHQATKLISKAYGREIVVRDRNRFHHFRDGRCSCGDYW